MLRFTDGKFKIMQIADVQEIPQVSPDTVKLISLAIRQEKPDLIIFTGDQLYGLLPMFHIGNRAHNIRQTLQKVLQPVEENGVPFAVTFGNHDEQAGLSNAQQAPIYAEFPHYLPGKRRSDEDPGTLLISVQDKTGTDVINLLVVDSNGQTAAGEYLPVKEEQLQWIEAQFDEQRAAFGKALPTLVFQHIPVPEYYDVLEPAKRSQKGAVEAFRTHRHEFYVLPQALSAAGGFMGESPAIPDQNGGEFTRLRQSGCVKGIFVGHDHNNSFAAALDGIQLVYTQCAGFHVYGPGRKRGVRIIELSEEAPADFTTRTVTFDSLTKDRLHMPLIPFTLDHLPTSMEQVKRIAVLGGAAAICSGAAAAGLCRLRKK